MCLKPLTMYFRRLSCRSFLVAFDRSSIFSMPIVPSVISLNMSSTTNPNSSELLGLIHPATYSTNSLFGYSIKTSLSAKVIHSLVLLTVSFSPLDEFLPSLVDFLPLELPLSMLIACGHPIGRGNIKTWVRLRWRCCRSMWGLPWDYRLLLQH